MSWGALVKEGRRRPLGSMMWRTTATPAHRNSSSLGSQDSMMPASHCMRFVGWSELRRLSWHSSCSPPRKRWCLGLTTESAGWASSAATRHPFTTTKRETARESSRTRGGGGGGGGWLAIYEILLSVSRIESCGREVSREAKGVGWIYIEGRELRRGWHIGEGWGAILRSAWPSPAWYPSTSQLFTTACSFLPRAVIRMHTNCMQKRSPLCPCASPHRLVSLWRETRIRTKKSNFHRSNAVKFVIIMGRNWIVPDRRDYYRGRYQGLLA